MASEDKWMALGVVLSCLVGLLSWFILAPSGFWEKLLGVLLFFGIAGFGTVCTVMVIALGEDSGGRSDRRPNDSENEREAQERA